MKKLFVILFVLMMLPVCAMAEEPAQLVDVTGVVILALLLLVMIGATVCAHLWRKYVRPWLEKKNMLWIAEYADEAVMFAEALIGRGFGTEKWECALEKMKDFGFYVNDEAVKDALKAAWKRLDLKQIAAGEKLLEEIQIEEKE